MQQPPPPATKTHDAAATADGKRDFKFCQKMHGFLAVVARLNGVAVVTGTFLHV
jgi:hypothetical protein